MTNDWGFNEDGTEGTESNGLRQFAERVNTENKALKERLDALEKVAQKATIGDTFEKLGVSRSLATHYQGEADPDKISTWVNDVRTALGGAPAAPAAQAPVAPVADANALAQYQQMTEAGQGAVTNNSTVDEWNARAAQATSVDDLHALWASIK